jgi:hypothetical protein
MPMTIDSAGVSEKRNRFKPLVANGSPANVLQNGNKIKRKKDIYQHGLRLPRPIPVICHDPHPSYFSLPTTL